MRFNLTETDPDQLLAFWRVSTRLDRAVTNVDHVEEVAPDMFQVPSTRTGELYTVDLQARTCTCKDFQFRGSVNGLPCKHILAAHLAKYRKPQP